MRALCPKYRARLDIRVPARARRAARSVSRLPTVPPRPSGKVFERSGKPRAPIPKPLAVVLPVAQFPRDRWPRSQLPRRSDVGGQQQLVVAEGTGKGNAGNTGASE